MPADYALPCAINMRPGPDQDYRFAGAIIEFKGLDGEPIGWEPGKLAPGTGHLPRLVSAIASAPMRGPKPLVNMHVELACGRAQGASVVI